jgi:hypothetical protein
MSIFKNLFVPNSEGKEFKKACYNLNLLPLELTDLTPYKCQLGGGLMNDPVVDKYGHKFCRGCAA